MVMESGNGNPRRNRDGLDYGSQPGSSTLPDLSHNIDSSQSQNTNQDRSRTRSQSKSSHEESLKHSGVHEFQVELTENQRSSRSRTRKILSLESLSHEDFDPSLHRSLSSSSAQSNQSRTHRNRTLSHPSRGHRSQGHSDQIHDSGADQDIDFEKPERLPSEYEPFYERSQSLGYDYSVSPEMPLAEPAFLQMEIPPLSPYNKSSTPEELRQDPELENHPRKVAPRSKDLFRVGPPFQDTAIHTPLFCASTNVQIYPEMSTRIDRGFELGEAGYWIGYKRNYFTLVSTFVFKDWTMEKFLRSQYYALANGVRVDIRYFALAISVRCNKPDVHVGLVQHTPKRDKGPRFSTPIYQAVPGGQLPDHEVVSGSCNRRNGYKLAVMKQIFKFDKAEYYASNNIHPQGDRSILRNYPGTVLTKVARFERIQFTASLRFKPLSEIQKYYTLSVELLGIGDDPELNQHSVLLATSDSCPLLVRGRSPSNYHMDKTSGYRGPVFEMENYPQEERSSF